MHRRLRALATEAKSEAEALADRGAERVRHRYPSWKVERVASADSPYRAIVTRAGEWKPDLVVVGSHGRSAAGRAVLGSVSQQVLHYAPCSVRIARRPDDVSRLAEEPPKLIVGIDGSPDAASAVSAVSMRPWPKGTRAQVIVAMDLRAVTALAALGPPEGAYASLVPAATDEKAWAHEAAENAARELRDAGVAATPLVLNGDPKRVLVDVAERWGADCVFVGAKGHSRMERFLLGSVSSAVAARASCSVEVVRQGT
jgi:nucleotide-binding universal stress UspA family protein